MVGVAVFLLTRSFLPSNVSEQTAASLPEDDAAPRDPSRSSAAQPSGTLHPVAQSLSEGKFTLESKGYIIPAHQILVTPQVSGRLMKLHIEEGMRVKRNQVLAEVEKIEYEAEMNRAQALLESAQQKLLELERGNRPEEIALAEAELAEISAQLPQLESESRRTKELRAKGSVSAQEQEKADSSYQAMQRRSERMGYALKLMKDGPRPERIAVARSEVAQLAAELVKAKWKFDNCTVRAPIDGTILKKNAEEGNLVNPIAFNGSFSICDMADLADLEVDLNIQERDISRVFVGQRCQVRAEAYPDRVYQGVVSRLMPIADRAKGAIPVRVKLTVPADEEGVYLKPEMGAVVAFLSRAEPELRADSQAEKGATPADSVDPSTRGSGKS